MVLAAIQKGIYSRDKQIKGLQSQLSSITAERDGARKFWAAHALSEEKLTAERDAALKEVEVHKMNIEQIVENASQKIINIEQEVVGLKAKIENHHLPDIESYKLTIDMLRDEANEYLTLIKDGGRILNEYSIMPFSPYHLRIKALTDKYKKAEHL